MEYIFLRRQHTTQSIIFCRLQTPVNRIRRILSKFLPIVAFWAVGALWTSDSQRAVEGEFGGGGAGGDYTASDNC